MRQATQELQGLQAASFANSPGPALSSDSRKRLELDPSIVAESHFVGHSPSMRLQTAAAEEKGKHVGRCASGATGPILSKDVCVDRMQPVYTYEYKSLFAWVQGCRAPVKVSSSGRLSPAIPRSPARHPREPGGREAIRWRVVSPWASN